MSQSHADTKIHAHERSLGEVGIYVIVKQTNILVAVLQHKIRLASRTVL